MESIVKPFDDFTIPRVAQLTQRSNQFNLRTIRYTDEDIKRIASNPDYFTISLNLRDKFGDHGLIAVIILQKQDNKTLFIDTWIMSCRVLKRGMEQFTLNTIATLAKENGFDTIIGEYLPTKKNGIVKDHYSDLGFVMNNTKWELDLKGFEEKATFINKVNN
jgi:FkbH-like protein